jgi:hypothetical protein
MGSASESATPSPHTTNESSFLRITTANPASDIR